MSSIAIEPMARTRAAKFRMWREGSTTKKRTSYSFAVPVIPGYEGVVRWALCRIFLEVVEMNRGPRGNGYGFQINIVLLDQGTLTPINVLKVVESKDAWHEKRIAMRRGAVTSEVIHKELLKTGITANIIKKAMIKWVGEEDIYGEEEGKVR